MLLILESNEIRQSKTSKTTFKKTKQSKKCKKTATKKNIKINNKM